jgi:hypothetical protein
MRQQPCQLMDPNEKKRPAAVAEPAVRLFRATPGVLVVDDDHLVRMVVQLGLERKGFNVWLAATGREAPLFTGRIGKTLAWCCSMSTCRTWTGPRPSTLFAN